MRGPRSPHRRKLKESCSQCAYVKVKCTKEKPTCVRCQSRDLHCNYEISHRAGRRPATARGLSTESIPPHRAGRSSSSPSSTAPHAEVAANKVIADPMALPGSTSLSSTLAEDPICDFPLPPIHNELSGTHMSPGMSLGLDFPPLLPDRLPPSLHSPADKGHRPAGASLGTISDTMLSTMLDFDIYSWWQTSDASNQLDNQATSASIPSVSSLCHGTCIGQSSCSLRMLTALAGAQPVRNAPGPWIGGDATGSLGVNEAMGLNQHILQVATSILYCPCLQTNHQLRYLLAFTAMDVLARHAAVAASVTANGEDHLAHASLVFGELHRVLQFIDLLFQRCRHPPSFVSPRSSPRRSPDPNASLNFSDLPIPTDSGDVVTRRHSPQMLEFEGDQIQPQSLMDSTLFDPAFLPLEGEVRRQFERVRDEIKSILRAV